MSRFFEGVEVDHPIWDNVCNRYLKVETVTRDEFKVYDGMFRLISIAKEVTAPVQRYFWNPPVYKPQSPPMKKVRLGLLSGDEISMLTEGGNCEDCCLDENEGGCCLCSFDVNKIVSIH